MSGGEKPPPLYDVRVRFTEFCDRFHQMPQGDSLCLADSIAESWLPVSRTILEQVKHVPHRAKLITGTERGV